MLESPPSLAITLAALLGDALTPAADTPETVFHAVSPPGIGLDAYLSRLACYSYASSSALLVAFVLLKRVVRSGVEFGELTAHRLLLSAMTVAAKSQDDVYYSNAHYARVGGVGLAELNGLEMAFLAVLEWRVVVTPDEFWRVEGQVMRGGRRRLAAPAAGAAPSKIIPSSPATLAPVAPAMTAEEGVRRLWVEGKPLRRVRSEEASARANKPPRWGEAQLVPSWKGRSLLSALSSGWMR